MLKQRQITVFGGAGFIGRHIVRRLAKTGATICVPTRDTENAMILKPMGDVGQIVPMTCSVRSDAHVARAIGKSDTVINLIGVLYEKGRSTFQAMHVETAARIARLAKEQGAARYVHFSAIGADAQSASAYARSKDAGERAAKAFFPDAAIFRPSIVFGPEDHFFNKFAAMAQFSPVLPLIGGGATKFQPVYAGDVAEAVAAVLEQQSARGATYELGGPEIYSFRQLMEIMLTETRRDRCLASVPWTAAAIKGAMLGLLPNPLLTLDQVRLLKTDNVVGKNAKTLRDLGISPTALEVILPTYLDRYRPVKVKLAA